jgi:TPR repeat protein
MSNHRLGPSPGRRWANILMTRAFDFLEGGRIPVDLAKAAKYYKLAADQHHAAG